MNENGLNYIDLFAGAGGLSEGFIQSGYRPVAHVEMNEHAAKTIETRIAYYYLKDNGKIKSYYDYEKGKITREQLLDKIPKEELKTVINKEMSESTIKGIFNTIDDIKREREIDKIDVIIGGPPCQAYSLVGRAQSSHMIVPMEDDPRNELYKMYVQFLKKYKPRMFVFENVAGIKTARGGQAFKNLQTYMKRVGYEIDYHELNAQDFGVLQSRKRVIIVGWLKGTGYEYPSFDVIHSKAEVWDLLKDLPPLTPGIEAREHTMNDMRRLKKYVKDNAIRMKSDVLTGHAARPHTAQDIEIYKRTIDMWFENEQHKRLKYDDLPEDLKTHKNRTSFIDRFKVVEGDMDHCHTILAHLSKDGHYFIHPDRNVYKNGSKMANSLYELTKGIPKILLTATPMQNTLLDIYGLVQFIDDRVFYSKQIFSERYLRGEDYNDLKACLEPVVQRTLRKEVAEYIQFSERKEMTIDFELSPMEIELYVIDDMPEHAFSMLQMGSPKKKSEVIQNLRTLTEMYGSWITDVLTNDEAMHDDKFKATGQTIIDKCTDANRRMNAGIDLIENNDKVYQSLSGLEASEIIRSCGTLWNFYGGCAQSACRLQDESENI